MRQILRKSIALLCICGFAAGLVSCTKNEVAPKKAAAKDQTTTTQSSEMVEAGDGNDYVGP